ncbi:hypothetical protein ACFXKC_18170 [Streptomyces sp. NPDC059340]|uniref:hypothetical protein n=1 Tax=Streptomyces sp. NPDC059340 TaxID=3346806 RepID=UPI0036C62154
MSAPVSHHPLVVNTADGSCWLRRAVTSDGRGLYALAGSAEGVPDEVLTSLAELAELGITGSAFALPVPVGTELRDVEEELIGANLSLYEERLDSARLRLALKSAQRGRRELRARVSELELERHSTNEALDDAVQALRADRAEPVKRPSASESANRLTAFFAPVASLREESAAEVVTPRVQAMRALLDGQRAAVEDPHDGPLAHRYRVGRDLPEMGGAQ